MAKILYLSCHSILEFEEVSLLHELGHEVFSLGAYVDPENPADNALRPSIPGLVYNSEALSKFHAIGQEFPGLDAKDHLSQEFVDYFDIVIVMHIPTWISCNWKVLKDKRVIWRTIGQSISPTEKALTPYRSQGLQVVRYSPMEHNIPGFIGEDALIRFYKNPDEYGNWTGEKKRIITFAQNMQYRGVACNFDIFEQVTRPFNRALYGPGNETAGDWAKGAQSYEDLKKAMRENRVYFYTGTHPASYTLNFMEAWMTGIPIVAIGSKYGNANYFQGHNLYEVPNLIENGINGFCSDNLNDLQVICNNLLKDDSLAAEISKNGRESALQYFGKETVKEKWEEFLK